MTDKPTKPLNEFSTAIDIYTKDKKKYDKRKIKNIDIEKVNFVYDHAIAFMESMHNSMKVINARAALLLGYLFTLSGSLILSFIHNWCLPIQHEKMFRGALLVEYILIMLVLSVVLILGKPKATYREPRFFTKQNRFKHEIKMIKIIMIDRLQERIDFNFSRLIKIGYCVNGCIIATIAFPFVTIILIHLLH